MHKRITARVASKESAYVKYFDKFCNPHSCYKESILTHTELPVRLAIGYTKAGCFLWSSTCPSRAILTPDKSFWRHQMERSPWTSIKTKKSLCLLAAMLLGDLLGWELGSGAILVPPIFTLLYQHLRHNVPKTIVVVLFWSRITPKLTHTPRKLVAIVCHPDSTLTQDTHQEAHRGVRRCQQRTVSS